MSHGSIDWANEVFAPRSRFEEKDRDSALTGLLKIIEKDEAGDDVRVAAGIAFRVMLPTSTIRFGAKVRARYKDLATKVIAAARRRPVIEAIAA